MSRKPRIISPSGIYHIVIRSINQQQLFEEDADYQKFLFVLSDVQAKYPFALYAYCLMGNHVHLLLAADEATLKTIFQSLGSRFVYWYNAKYQRFGHLFQDRYFSKPIENDESFLCVMQYIHENPVRAGICSFATDYYWSSCRAYYGKKNDLINKEPAVKIAGSPRKLLTYFHTHFCEVTQTLPQNSHLMPDETAMQIITALSHCSNPSQFQNLPRCERNRFISRFAHEGLHIAQIARLCGISRTTIYRILQK